MRVSERPSPRRLPPRGIARPGLRGRSRDLPRSLILLLLAAASTPLPAATGGEEQLERAVVHHRAGRLEEALTAYREVAAGYAETEPAVAARARNNGCALLNSAGDHSGAETECRAALALWRSLDQPRRLGRTLNNLGLALQYQGRYDEAGRQFRAALAINRRLEDMPAQALNLANLGALATLAGRFSEAIAHHDAAADLAARHAGEPWAADQLAVARINRGVVLEKLGAYREALDLYREVLAAGDAPRDRRASLLVNSGVIYRNLGDPVTAIERFDEAAAIYRQLGDVAALSNARLNTALAWHVNLRRLNEAEAAYREALRLAESAGDQSEVLQDLFYLGRLLLERGRLDEADEAFTRCLETSTASGSAEGRWSALEGRGRVLRARGDLAKAYAALEQAMDEVESVRGNLEPGRLRSGFFGDQRAVFATAVEVLLDLATGSGDTRFGERALEVAQRAKARELIEALGGTGGPAEPLTAAAIRDLAKDGVLLEFFVAETRLVAWRVADGAIHAFDLGPAAPIADRVVAAHRRLSRGDAPAPADLAELSGVLLAPLARGQDPPTSLVVAPDGALHYLPFELLAWPGGDGPLVETTTLSYLPSASTMARPPRPAQNDRLSLLGMADPSVSFDDPAAPAALRTLVERFDFGPLPASARELDSIASRIGGRHQLLVGDRATEEAFRLAAPRGAAVVHLATHTVIDERPGRGAAILLAPSPEHDGLLYPDEVAALQATADLTVLAACRTAFAGAADSRALATLTGSFLASGSTAVIATLWDVGDAATASFMDQFYYELGRGQAPATALRAAKRRLRQDPEWGHPALWSAYVLVGEGGRAVVRPRGRWLAWIAVLPLAAAAWLLLRRRG